MSISKVLFLFTLFFSSWSWAGTCQVREAYRDGYARSAFDEYSLEKTTTLHGCRKISRQSSFRNRFVLVFVSESQREYEILNGEIRKFSSPSMKL